MFRKNVWRLLFVASIMLVPLVISSSGLAQSSDASPTEMEVSSVELTIYNQDRGVVKEQRTVVLAEGVNEVRFTDVASSIDPTTVQVVSLTDPEGTHVLEQNYEYDLVGSTKLLEKYIDQEIELTTVEGSTYTGTLLSASDGIVLETEEGIRLINSDQVREFMFPQLPDGLLTKPTLVWLVESAAPGEQTLRTTYMTSGITWDADYVAVLSNDDSEMALNGWVTIVNNSGATYTDALVKLVAGDVNVESTQTIRATDLVYAAEAAVSTDVEERDLFEYHVYEIQRPVTVKDAQTKQIEFTSAPTVDVNKVYLFEGVPITYSAYSVYTDPTYGTGYTTDIQVLVEFTNSEEAGLGLPLPAGTVRVYQEDVDGSPEFVGEDSIDHTPKNEDLSLYLGNAFDLVGERTQLDVVSRGDIGMDETIEITLRNHKDEDVTIRVIEYLFRAEDATITKADADYEMVDAHTAQFDVDVPADGEATVTYTVRYTW